MTGKAKPKKHTAKEIAAKVDAATTNGGGGKAGQADRSGAEKGGHAKFECPHCKVTTPDVKSMQIHHDARHPKIPFEESRLVNLHVSNVPESSKPIVCLVFFDPRDRSFYCYSVDVEDGGRKEQLFYWTRDCGAGVFSSFGVLESKLYAIQGEIPYKGSWRASSCTFCYDFNDENPSLQPGPNLNNPVEDVLTVEVNNMLYLFPNPFMAYDEDGRFAGFEFLCPGATWQVYEHPTLDTLCNGPEETFYSLYEECLEEFKVRAHLVYDSKILVWTDDRGMFGYDVMEPKAGWVRINPTALPFAPLDNGGVHVGGGTFYAVEESLFSYTLDDKGEIIQSQTLYIPDPSQYCSNMGLIRLHDNYFCLVGCSAHSRKLCLEVLRISPSEGRAIRQSLMFCDTEIPPGHDSRLIKLFKVNLCRPSIQEANDGHSLPVNKQVILPSDTSQELTEPSEIQALQQEEASAFRNFVVAQINEIVEFPILSVRPPITNVYRRKRKMDSRRLVPVGSEESSNRHLCS